MDSIKISFLLGMALSSLLFADEITVKQTAADLIELDFEELVKMDVEVQSAGKSAARAMDLPYAAYIITAREIQQSGVNSVPDALRLAPGVSVNQISTTEWSVAIRGQGGRFSRYVLVMIDGRIAYNLAFSGVNWDELNVVLADIDRIEVICGPNAAAWGANAVNGIINIITRRAAKEPGTRLSAAFGNNERQMISASTTTTLPRGWQLGASGHSNRRGGLGAENGSLTEDEQTDWRLSGDLYRLDETTEARLSADWFATEHSPYWQWIDPDALANRQTAVDEAKAGWAVQADFKLSINDDWNIKLRASSDHTGRDSKLFEWESTNKQVDFELGGNWRSHRISAGVNTRFSTSKIISTEIFPVGIQPPENDVDHYGVFISDAVDLSDTLELSLAARIDRSELSKANLQPSLRLLWETNDSTRLWLAASKATSTPSLAFLRPDNIPYAIANTNESPLPILIVLNGHPGNFEDTQVSAIEMGFRKVYQQFNLEIALFNFDYSNDAGFEFTSDPELVFDSNYAPSHLIQRVSTVNNVDYSSSGGEISANAQISNKWSMQLHYSRFSSQNSAQSWSSTLSVVSGYSVTDNIQWNLWVRHAHRPNSNYDTSTWTPEPDNYLTLDSNITWAINPHLQLEFIANNLFTPHTEAIREEFTTDIMEIEPYLALRVGLSF